MLGLTARGKIGRLQARYEHQYLSGHTLTDAGQFQARYEPQCLSGHTLTDTGQSPALLKDGYADIAYCILIVVFSFKAPMER